MKIFYDHEAFSIQEYGGVSRYFFEIISRLKKYNNCQPILSKIYSNNKYLLSMNGQFEDNFFNFEVKNLNTKILSYINNFFEKNVNCSVHHKTYYSNFYKQKSPNIITIHDLIAEKYSSSYPSMRNDAYLKEQSIKNSNYIIAVSEKTKSELINYYNVPEDKISVIYHGGDYSYINNKNNNFNYPKKPYFLYIGKRFFYKNFNNLLKAFAIDKSLSDQFDLICLGGGEFTNEELDLFKKLDLNLNNMKSYKINDNTLKHYYKNASALIYPSTDEGFGIPILEAMYNKCLVLCSEIDVFKEIYKDKVIYFNPFDEYDILNKIIYLLNIKNKSTFKNDCFNFAKKFNWDKTALETYLIYKKFEKNN